MEDWSRVLLGLTILPLILATAEAGWYRATRFRSYGWAEGIASLAVYAGHLVTLSLLFAVVSAWSQFAVDHRLLEIDMGSWWSYAVLFLVVEFFYYWFHRADHTLRFLWASHGVHHSSNDINLLTAYRLGWTYHVSASGVIWFPPTLIGFPLEAVLITQGLIMGYQALLHTEAIRSLGPFEHILNTPSHHRVHHGTQPHYLNRNFGGATVIFDHLFGTLARERKDDPCVYGLTDPMRSLNPFTINAREWIGLGRDLVRSRSLREVAAALWLPLAPRSKEAPGRG